MVVDLEEFPVFLVVVGHRSYDDQVEGAAGPNIPSGGFDHGVVQGPAPLLGADFLGEFAAFALVVLAGQTLDGFVLGAQDDRLDSETCVEVLVADGVDAGCRGQTDQAGGWSPSAWLNCCCGDNCTAAAVGVTCSSSTVSAALVVAVATVIETAVARKSERAVMVVSGVASIEVLADWPGSLGGM